MDLDASRVSINHTVVLVDGKTVPSTPKTAKGRRTVPLDPDLVAAFRIHRRRQREERLAFGSAWVDTGYMFTAEDGRPLHPEYVSTRWQTLVRRAGVRPLHLHGAPHTCATLALAAGIPTEYVSQWLGHANASITQDLYQHVIPSMSVDQAAKLTALVLNRKGLRPKS